MWWAAVASLFMQMMQQANQASAQKDAAAAQERAAAEAKDISARNAANEEAATQETARKQGKIDQANEAAARAAAAASGFSYDEEDTAGSIALTLAAQKEENRTRAEYAKSAGASRADIIRRGGQAAYQSGMSQASATSSAAAGSAFGALGSGLKAGKGIYDWWDTSNKASSFQNTGESVSGFYG